MTGRSPATLRMNVGGGLAQLDLSTRNLFSIPSSEVMKSLELKDSSDNMSEARVFQLFGYQSSGIAAMMKMKLQYNFHV